MIDQTISRYRVTGKLGEGGMGEVYRALDARLGREVALKVLPEAFARDDERLMRFAREAQVLASLNHPNIASVFDLEEHDGRQVLVMELVEGETLAERLRGGPLPVADAVRLALQIAEALRAAHRKGVVHRDLKPANIKVTPDGLVKVLDFGLAKRSQVCDAADTEAPTIRQVMTLRGEILGTPAYMAPEQALGERADARCDVFSFGAVLYEMLTGRRAFSGPTLTEVVRAVLSSTPPPPRRLRADVPAELDALVMHALRKEREQRPADMGRVCAGLKRLSAKEDGRTLAPSALGRARVAAWGALGWAGENRRRAYAAAAVAALLLAAGAYGLRAYVRRERPDAATPATPLAPPAISVDTSAGPYELFQQGMEYLKRFDKEERVNAAVEAFQAALAKNGDYAPAYAGLGLAYVVKFTSNRDKALLEMAVQNAKRAVELDGHMALNRVSLGRAYVEKGEYDLAEPELKQALTLEPSNADAHRVYAELQNARKNAGEAERLYRKAVELRPDDWSLHYALGTFYFLSSRYADAESALKESVRLVPDCHMSHRNLGATYHMQGRFPEAAAAFQKSLQIKPGASTYTNLGTALFFQGLYQQSVVAMEKAVELGANNHQLWANLGDAYRYTKGNERKAVEAYTRAVQIARKELEGKPGDPDLLSRVALSLVKSGDKRQGLAEAAALNTVDKKAVVLARLVLVYELSGDRAGALQAMEEALKKGHSMEEFSRDPDLLELRKDPKYHRLAVRLPDAPHE